MLARTMTTRLSSLLCSLLFLLPGLAAAQAPEPLPVHVFVRDGCVHCADAEEFFDALDRPDLRIVYHDIAEEAERTTFDRINDLAGLPSSTPVTFVAGEVIQGFATGDTTGVMILEAADRALRAGTGLTLAEYLEGKVPVRVRSDGSACPEDGSAPCEAPTGSLLVHVPLLGAVDLRAYSLPVMSAILGFVDGFNPCAMWVLVTFLLVLVQLPDRRKVWQVAGLFIAAETIMYYLILNVWFTAWDFIGLDRIVTPIVGLVAIGAGVFFLWEAKTSDGTCKVTNTEQRRKIRLRITDIASLPFTLATALAVIGLALSVNIIEFACSIGIPQAFTKILDLNGLSLLSRQAMMAIYIVMYMVDDLIVFGIALWSVEHIHLTHRYSRACNLLGGALMLVLGLLLLLKPELLRLL